MEDLLAIAVKADLNKNQLVQKTQHLCDVHDFKVPAEALRVGTLDSLMSLSDDLAKMDMLGETTALKLYSQLVAMKGDAITIGGVDVRTYVTRQWEWDEAKFQLKTPLRELCESISARIGGVDEELKSKLLEVNTVKGSLQAMERKTQGNLMVRSLADVVTKEDMVESDYMTTQLVVVSKSASKDFLNCYQSLAQYVVPLSAKLITEDSEYALYAVTLFKKCQDQFKQACREKRFNARDFTYDPEKVEADDAKKETDTVEFERLQNILINWCQINFAEAFAMSLHLKAIRIFVESVLRYGLTSSRTGAMRPNFQSFVLVPKKGKVELLRKALLELYSTSSVFDSEELETSVPGAGAGEFYPYVSVNVPTEPAVL